MITDPELAPKRTDLPWLRRRHLPGPAAALQPEPGTAALRDFLAGRTTARPQQPARDQPATGLAPPQPRPQRPAEPAPAGSSLDLDAPGAPAPAPGPSPSLDLDEPAAPPVRRAPSLDLDEPAAPPARPGPSSSLELDEPAAPPARPGPSSSLELDEPAAPPARPGPSSSLELDEPAAPPARPGPSSSLDLSEPAAPARPAPAPARQPSRRRRMDRRVRPQERIILGPAEPTVTLTPLQSGIGVLTIEAAASAEAGDLRLGAVYELGTDSAVTLQMTMQMTQGNRFAPPHSRRPVLVSSRERFERISVDLRQVRSLRRMIVYAFSGNREPISWGGTLLVTTFGGGRIEVPLESLHGPIAVPLSVYRVRGELVLRAERQPLDGDVREAARAYGYGKITWLDDRTPVE